MLIKYADNLLVRIFLQNILKNSHDRNEQQLHCKNLKCLCQYIAICVLSTRVTNRSALEDYAGNFPYYVGVMLYAFQLLLCLKLCRHNQHRPIATPNEVV